VNIDLQGVCETLDVVEGNVPRVTFNVCDEGAVEACLQR